MPTVHPAETPIPVSAGTFAEICGVHHNTVTNWIADGLPALRDRRTTSIEVGLGVAWVRARDRRDHEKRLAELNASRDADASKAAKLAAEARLREMEVAERQGRLIPADEVEARWTQIAVSIREAVMGVPGAAVQSGLIEATQEPALDVICREALAGLGPSSDAEEARVA